MTLSSSVFAFTGLLALGASSFFPPGSAPVGSSSGPRGSAPRASDAQRQCGPTRPAPPRPTEPRPTIEVVFVLDTTGSMGGLLEGAKAKIWAIASRIVQGRPTPRLRVGLVGYRDLDDAYVTRVHPLREDLDAVYADLRSFRAEGGGDTPEHVARGLRHAVESMQWSTGEDVLKVVYLVGDAPPHAYENEPSAAHWTRAARRRGIVVNTVRCGTSNRTQASFRKLAQVGGGLYFAVAQDGGVAAVTTPFDDEIRRLEREAGALALVGGRAPARRASRAKKEAFAGLSAEATADRSAYHAAAGAAPRRWAADDAVDLAAEPEALERLQDHELPAELKPLSAAERRARVEERARRRAEIDQRLRRLTAERRAHLEERTSTDDGVDDRVLADIRRRAQALGVSYETGTEGADSGK
jgi:hypothetical protein